MWSLCYLLYCSSREDRTKAVRFELMTRKEEEVHMLLVSIQWLHLFNYATQRKQLPRSGSVI